MTDLDFDELDKAVNSLMTGTSNATAPDDTAASPVVTAPPVHNDTSSPQATPSGSSASTNTTSASPTAGSLATKRRGQFMDIVRPGNTATAASSASAPAVPAAPAAPAMRRQGISVQPSAELAARVEAEAEEHAHNLAIDMNPTPELDMEATGTEQPDTAESHDGMTDAMNTTGMDDASTDSATIAPSENVAFDDKPSPEQLEEPAIAADSAVDNDDHNNDNSLSQLADHPGNEDTHQVSQASEEPLSSPFLPNAQVEKRPLGTPPSSSGSTETNLPETPAETTEPSDERATSAPSIGETTPVTDPTKPDTQADIKADTPPDEHGAVPDSKPETKPKESHEEAPVPAAPAAPKKDPFAPNLSDEKPDTGTPDIPLPVELRSDVVALESSNTSMTSTAAQPVSSPAGGSISQQYTEQPSSGDQTNGAIYDTATYHKAVEPVTHKKDSKKTTWVLWALVLLVIGAIAGAAYFYWSTQA